MSNVKKLSIALTHDMAETVKSAVQSGEYGSNSEVIRDALRKWTANRNREQEEINYLRKAWQKGIDSGPGKLKNIDDIIAAAKA
jgi:antitoxin ParD1/3/4